MHFRIRNGEVSGMRMRNATIALRLMRENRDRQPWKPDPERALARRLARAGEWCRLGDHPISRDEPAARVVFWAGRYSGLPGIALGCICCFDEYVAERVDFRRWQRAEGLRPYGDESDWPDEGRADVLQRGWEIDGGYRYRRQVRTGPCAACGRQLTYAYPLREGTAALVCSIRCREQLRRTRHRVQPAAVCSVCGTAFTPARADALTCSPRCRQAAYRARHRDR